MPGASLLADRPVNSFSLLAPAGPDTGSPAHHPPGLSIIWARCLSCCSG